MIYLDTSAFLKTVLDEPQSAALDAYLENRRGVRLVSSALLLVEARRGVLRSNPARLPRTDLGLARVSQLDITEAVLESASRLPDPLLRSLDAIHLATALLIREDVDALLTYDDRLAQAARSHGLPVAAPA
ncbi:MAG: type II toxin-antitoxin system VapC family toxin [Pseudonocardia sp.]|nr:type II toxin-antitoxin system VapC family toxin [Pseudonocardia sp.]